MMILIDSICCDVRFQYALHTTHLEDQPVSDRTFSCFREKVYNYSLEHDGVNLFEDEMKSLADVFTKYMNLTSNIKRMDSLMIASRCKRMSRLEIIYTVTANAVKLLHCLGQDSLIKPEMLHYLNENDCNQIIYHCKGEVQTKNVRNWNFLDSCGLLKIKIRSSDIQTNIILSHSHRVPQW